MSSAIAWNPEEATDALKEFVGQIVAVDYSNEPFGFKGAPGIVRKGKVLGIQVRTDVYDKDQYEWYPPSRVKKTKPVELVAVGGTLGDSLPAASNRIDTGVLTSPVGRQMALLY